MDKTSSCSIPNCNRPLFVRGWCQAHYTRWYRHGDPLAGRTPPDLDPPEERFWKQVEKTESCWLWTGLLFPNGYGRFIVDGRDVLAHRYAYQLLVGSIPEDRLLDHVWERGCRSRACVWAPNHLEPVTQLQNMQRSEPARRTHCPKGHPYDEANTYRGANGRRQCVLCRQERSRGRPRRRELNAEVSRGSSQDAREPEGSIQ